ncbi:DNA polymerase III subunit beta [Lapidilactobacillus luobeiensis]|uniref:DNA polymerase III subunit beta n=1 Tax=Lapidilactobacillus luobeiensis TaxID=2950371 RepID=UPI0021C29BB4|nr:DNA polymerase III subunit beta [Lapidilactobacillus luobeiensis]
MKFTINRNSFIRSFNDVLRAIPAKTTIPSLTGVKLDLTNDGLLLTGSNSDISIETFMSSSDEDLDLQIESVGSVVLTARFFGEVVKRLPEETFTLEVRDDYQTRLTSGKSEFTVIGTDANEYPRLPEVEDQNELKIAAGILRELINQTVLAVSDQETRPILTGVNFSIDGNGLLAVATDSHRLAQRKLDLPDITSTYQMVIPGKSLQELGRMLADQAGDISLKISDNQVLFSFGATKFYTRLLEGNYPDTARLIPTDHNVQLQINAASLLAAIERAALLSHASRANVVRLVLAPEQNSAILSGTSPDVGNVEEALPVDALTGDELDISFNPDYMKDALRAFGPTEIDLNFTTNLRPFTLVPSEDGDHFVQLITPVRTFN